MKVKGLIALLLISATAVFFPTKLYANSIIECEDCNPTELKDKVELHVLQNGLSNGEYVFKTFDPVRLSIQDAVAIVVRSAPNGGFGGMPSLGIDTTITVNLVQKSGDYLEAERKLRLHYEAIMDMKRIVIETFNNDPGIILQPGNPLSSVADALKDKESAGLYIADQMRRHRDFGPEAVAGEIHVDWGDMLEQRFAKWVDTKLGFDAFMVVYVEFPDGTVGELKIKIRPQTRNVYEVTLTGTAWFANGEALILNTDILASHGEITPDMINIRSLVGLMNSMDDMNVTDPNGIGFFGSLNGGSNGSGCVRIIDFLTDPVTGNKVPYIAAGC